uniref:Chromosome-associated kinesin KIF4 n=1 Tax=Anthurium amnicola TaxID=1678845 RepID=A0A1D1Z3M3_9ARAE
MKRKLFSLQKEIGDLRFNLANISSTSEDGAHKLKEEYLQKLNILEAQVSELKRKQEAQSQLLRQKQKSDEAAKRLQEEIQRIKTQKVQLQHKIKQESEQFRSWKASREKEVLQLKKEGRRNEYEMHKLLALNQRQKMVLQRKTEEAALATKRLKELLEAKKVSSREHSGVGNTNGPGIQALTQTIEHELEVILRVHEVRSKYERQLEARAAMANELMKLKDAAEVLKQKNMNGCTGTVSPSARNSRISALETMLATSSSTLVSMASHLSEAEERERLFSGRNRWNQVRSLPEAKNLLNYLFNRASSSRCELQDKDVTCLEKDLIIKELKEKVVRLTSLLRQSETQKVEMQKKLQELDTQKLVDVPGSFDSNTSNSGEDGHAYALRKGPRRSQFFNNAGYNLDLQEDMDTSDSEELNLADQGVDDLDDEDWVESGKKMVKRRSKTRNHPEKSATEESHSQEAAKLEILADAFQKDGKCESDSCCSCSKSSTCKTKKCECRAFGNSCGPSCGCIPSKCANRVDSVNKELIDELSEAGISKNQAGQSSVDLTISEESTELASHGAMLLQSAFNENHASIDEEVQQRRPLSDIGNTAKRSNVPKPNRRKKWRKSVVQLVPVVTAPPAQSEVNYSEPPKTRDDVVLRLPRAMGPRHLNSQPLGERNSVMADEHVESKDAGASTIQPRSPATVLRASDEKENHMA